MGQNNSSKESTIGKIYKCPNCQKTFPSETLTKEVNQHMVSCSNISQTKSSFLSNLFGKNSINNSKIKVSKEKDKNSINKNSPQTFQVKAAKKKPYKQIDRIIIDLVSNDDNQTNSNYFIPY